MASYILFILLSLSLSAYAATSPACIDWYACPQNSSIATTCGTLEVPLDYTATDSNQSLTLQLVKINATTQPSKGSVIFDFGGPGNINVDEFYGDYARALLLLTGGVYDIVTFEPRGTGITLPYSCYNSSAARDNATAATPSALGPSDEGLEAVWTAAGALAEACYENAGDIGELIGTSFVARDIMQIVDALGEDGLLRYYGFSYGTTLGATVAAMFPHRIDKLLLDGVENPYDYWSGTLNANLLDTDATLSAFFQGCIRSPELCPLAQIDDSAGELSRLITGTLETLGSSNDSTAFATYGSLKIAIIGSLYFPVTWPALADGLAAALQGNTSGFGALGKLIDEVFPPARFPNYGADVAFGVGCADAELRTNNLTDMLPILARYKAESWIRGDADIPTQALKCARWKLASKERYTGSFDNIRTKYPALIVGNSIDPTTPLTSARNLSEGFKGSVLLQNNGYGHTTIASPSLCTAKHIRAYFVNGTLPPVGTVCESATSLLPFAFKGSYYDTISSLAKATKRSTEAQPVDNDDALLNAVRDLGKMFARRKAGM